MEGAHVPAAESPLFVFLSWWIIFIPMYALLGYYAALIGNSGPIGCPETSVQNYHSTLHNSQKSVDAVYIAAEA
jgi:hypothetical protein